MIDREFLRQLREEDKKTYKEIGEILKVSKQRIHQIYKDYHHIRNNNKILKFFGNKCSVCGTTKLLEIHHKDSDTKNNNINNLTVLCRKHHNEEEKRLNKKKDIVKKAIIKEKNCEVCGKLFHYQILSRKNPKFCSVKCFSMNRYKTGKHTSMIGKPIKKMTAKEKKQYWKMKNDISKEYRQRYYKEYRKIHKNSTKTD